MEMTCVIFVYHHFNPSVTNSKPIDIISRHTSTSTNDYFDIEMGRMIILNDHKKLSTLLYAKSIYTKYKSIQIKTIFRMLKRKLHYNKKHIFNKSTTLNRVNYENN